MVPWYRMLMFCDLVRDVQVKCDIAKTFIDYPHDFRIFGVMTMFENVCGGGGMTRSTQMKCIPNFLTDKIR